MISTTLKSTSTVTNYILQFAIQTLFLFPAHYNVKTYSKKTFVNYWKLNRHPGFPSNQEVGRTWRATSSFNQTICVSYFHEHRFLFSNFPTTMEGEIAHLVGKGYHGLSLSKCSVKLAAPHLIQPKICTSSSKKVGTKHLNLILLGKLYSSPLRPLEM